MTDFETVRGVVMRLIGGMVDVNEKIVVRIVKRDQDNVATHCKFVPISWINPKWKPGGAIECINIEQGEIDNTEWEVNT